MGKCAGMKVCDAKPIIKQEMIENGQAFVYWEPESLVSCCCFVCVLFVCVCV